MESTITINVTPRYKLCAQNFPRNITFCILVIKDLMNNDFVRVAAHTVLQDAEFLAKLCAQDIQRIAYIYAMELAAEEVKLRQAGKSVAAANEFFE